MNRLKALEDMLDRTNRLVTLVDEFEGFQGFTVLQDWELMKIIATRGINTQKIAETKKEIRLVSTIPAGEGVEKHWHDFDEEFEILSGEISDELTGKTYVTGDKWFTPRFTAHEPINKGTTPVVLQVIATI